MYMVDSLMTASLTPTAIRLRPLGAPHTDSREGGLQVFIDNEISANNQMIYTNDPRKSHFVNHTFLVYSNRSASIGSSLVARQAGYKPKMNPLAELTPMAKTSAQYSMTMAKGIKDMRLRIAATP